jgi:hypothetical protein
MIPFGAANIAEPVAILVPVTLDIEARPGSYVVCGGDAKRATPQMLREYS